MNTAERHERNEMIAGLRARGVSVRQVAKSLDVSTETVRRVMAEFRAQNPTLRHSDPLQIVDELLMGYQADLEELAMMSSTFKAESSRVGAVNSRMAARDRIIALLQATGVLPHDLGKLKVEIDVRYIAAQIAVVLNRHHVPEEVQRDLLAALRGGELVEQSMN